MARLRIGGISVADVPTAPVSNGPGAGRSLTGTKFGARTGLLTRSLTAPEGGKR